MTRFDFLNLFVTPAGDQIFFILLVLLSAVGLAMTVSLQNDDNGRLISRYRISLVALLIASIGLWAISLDLLATIAPKDSLLPPLERAALLSVALLIGWSLLSADHQTWSRTGNVLVLILLALIAGTYLFTGIQWPVSVAAQNSNFNLSTFGSTWAFIAVILALLGTLLSVLLFRDINDALLKLLYCLLLLAGYGLTLLFTLQATLDGNYSGPARLGSLLALSLLPIALFRTQSRQLAVAKQTATTIITQPQQPVSNTQYMPPRPQHGGQSVQLLKLLGDVLESAEPLNLPEVIVRKVTEQIQADVSALLRVSDPNYADIAHSYNRIMGATGKGLPAISLDNQPTLINVLERRKQRALYPDRNAYELGDIYIHLDIDEHIGPAYLQPLIHKDEVIAVLFLGLPYTQRELNRDQLEWLNSIGILASSLLVMGYQALEVKKLAEDRAIEAVLSGVSPSQFQDADLISTREAMKSDLKLAREQVGQLSKQIMLLKTELDGERTRLAQLIGDEYGDSSVSQRIVAITSEQEQLRKERDDLSRKLQEAETALHGATAPDNEAIYDEISDMLRREKALLEEEKAQLEAQLAEMRAQSNQVALPSNVQALLNRMIEEKAQLEDERSQYARRLDKMNAQLQELGIEDGVTGLSNLIADLYQERASLQEQNADYERKLQALVAEREQLSDALQRETERDAQLRSLQEELTRVATDREAVVRQRDQLRVTLNDLQRQVQQLRNQRQQLAVQMSGRTTNPSPPAGNTSSQEDADLMVGLVQELRTPMTSITGYISLLRAEAAGILGEMQIEFLERVSTNITRLESMIDTLIKVTEISTGYYALEPRQVNLIDLVEDAITNASVQFRQKHLTVNLDLEESTPTLAADYDAMTQVIAQLINNAYLVSPPNSAINVIVDQRTMHLEPDDNVLTDVLYVAVEDKGGGIDLNDLPRVFARKYKANNPLIAGVGDTGIGLSIARTLVEKHNGRLWVETEAGSGSVFQFIIPLAHATDVQEA